MSEKIKCFFLIGLFGTVPVQVKATLIKEHVTLTEIVEFDNTLWSLCDTDRFVSVCVVLMIESFFDRTPL